MSPNSSQTPFEPKYRAKHMSCDIRQNSFIESCYSKIHLSHFVVQLRNAYLQLWWISFRVKIPFGLRFHSEWYSCFIRSEINIRRAISFGVNSIFVKFHSAWIYYLWNFIRREFNICEISFGMNSVFVKFHSAWHS